MATKEQYDFFKSQYDEENIRNNELTKRAEIYLSIISLFLTAVLFKIKDIFDSIKDVPTFLLTILLIVGLVSFAISLLFLINSLKIRDYEGVIDFNDFIEKNDDTTQSPEDFFEDRVADYIVAVKRNEIINNDKADLLIKSRIFILIGFLLTISFIILLLILKNFHYGKA